MTTTGSGVSSFRIDGTGAEGLSWEAPYLWVDEWKVTTAGSFVSSFHSPVGLRDLAWYGHHLWSGKRNDPYVYAVTTTGYGSIVASFRDPGGGSAGGMTFDGNYLWLYSYGSHWVYQVDIGVTAVGPGSWGKIKGFYR